MPREPAYILFRSQPSPNTHRVSIHHINISPTKLTSPPFIHMEPYPNGTENDNTPRQSAKRLLGKVAVITGGARGIGEATAKLFAENGAHVVIADVLDDLGASLAKAIEGRYMHCDVSREEEVESAIEEAKRWKGRVDIMVNNAGVSGTEGSITGLDMEMVKQVVAVNLMGTVHGIKHAARAMAEGGRGGSIICTSSSAAIMGGLASHEYTMSKAGMAGLVRSAACELGVKGIRVNSVVPHGVATEMLVVGYRRFGKADMTAEEVREVVGQRGSLLKGRGGTVEDVAHACVFLASDESGFVTAHDLVVDGGYTSANSSLNFIYY
ncbi:short-chain dehydrogenase reductase ATA1 [Prosopis cineraria]|uniref:short-chain dehydrogenase reductase ATA1 n=1 Tax=Prosopis cineraria TaxID=364024 RepID=UPI0024100593|nr:short-chain dehydrogenase reductase ATA1 [Prosopis cineraria]